MRDELSGNSVECIHFSPDSRIGTILNNKLFQIIPRLCNTGILYTIEQDSILILAVMHCSQEPGYWKNRKGR